METDKIRICYFPGRETSYVRNRVLINGLRQAGAIVHDCSSPHKNVLRYLAGFAKFLRCQRSSDVIFIGFYGQFLVPLVRLLTRKPILFDAFLCTYQTLAFDRRSIKPDGITAHVIRFVERLSARLADVVFLDTDQHIRYFVNEYRLDPGKFQRLLLGADDTLMFPREGVRPDNFIVHFHGEYQALHGTNTIIEAAVLVPNVRFQMVGGGRQFKACRAKARSLGVRNVEFIPLVPFHSIPDYIARASVCLGIFGDTEKTRLVIPIKVYETLAMAKPLITSDTPAVRELLTPQENVLLCRPADPHDLAQAIRRLQYDGALRETIAHNGHKIFQECCRPLCLGQQILAQAVILNKRRAGPDRR